MSYEIIFNNIVENLSNYLISNNLETMILGLSGGIDSTVCAAICRKVADKTGKKLIGVSLPSNTNKHDEFISAYNTNIFCDKYYERDITDIYDNMKKTLSESEDMFCYLYPTHPETKISLGNIKARIRMMYLYNLASVYNGIVIDTDNLTEHYLGFYTLHGDDGDVNVIGSLWKTEVYELAKYLAKNIYKGEEASCIKAAIKLVPTDGNGVSSSDLEQIGGKNYNEVDNVLKALLSNKDEIINEVIKKVGEETFNKIKQRMVRSSYKRQSRPLVVSAFETTSKGVMGKIDMDIFIEKSLK